MAFVEWLDKVKVHVAMVLVGAGYGAFFVLTKASLLGGVDPFLFATYRNGIGCLTLFLSALFLEREHWPKVTLEVVGFIIAMAVIGIYVQQTLFLIGLQHTNAIFASIVLKAVPAWAFLMAVIFRVEEVSVKRRDGQSKVLGILFCVAGAMILTLYKGFIIFGDSTPMSPPTSGVSLGMLSSALQGWEIDSWTFGALCLLACSLCIGTFINLQAPALKRFPAPFTLMGLTSLLGAFMFGTTAFFRVEASEWILPPGPILTGAIYAGVVAQGICVFLTAWANHKSGPILVAAYSPTSTLFSTFFGTIFLNSALYFGSVLGALAIVIGLYFVIWGTRESLRLKGLLLEIPTHGKQQQSADTSESTLLLVEPLLSKPLLEEPSLS